VSRYHDDRTRASDPGRIRLSRARLARLEPPAAGLPPELARRFSSRAQFEDMLDEHMQVGDSRAACVVSVEPLLVAAYTDELDCVAVLHFPCWLAAEHGLKVGDRLLTVNTYFSGNRVAPDLRRGPRQMRRYWNFYPVVADFFSDDTRRIEQRKEEIDEEEWQRCAEMGAEYLANFPGRWRSGSPFWSSQPTADQPAGIRDRPEVPPPPRRRPALDYEDAPSVRRSDDLGEDPAIRLLLPVGRSGWAIAAGYLGLVSVLLIFAPFALLTGILAVLDIRRNPKKHGMGRAVFGIVMGALFTVVLLLVLVAIAMDVMAATRRR
jgi:hypothetical protein